MLGIDYEHIDKNPPFYGRKNGTEGKKDQYLDRNDYSAQPDANALTGANKCKEQDAIFDGIMLTPPFAAFPSLVTTQQHYKSVQFFTSFERDGLNSH